MSVTAGGVTARFRLTAASIFRPVSVRYPSAAGGAGMMGSGGIWLI